MDNKQLTERLARSLGRSKSDAGKLLEALCGAITEQCGSLTAVAVPGFGTFAAVKHMERVEVAHDGTRTLVPPHVDLTFDTSNLLAKRIAETLNEHAQQQ